MAATILYMSISLDGFIAGPNEGPDNGLGDGGERLHEWIWTSDEPSGESSVPARPSGVNGTVWDEFMSTGAVVAGRGTFEPAGGWGGVLDEIELHVIPVLFGQGRRLFENLAAEQIELERTRILEGDGGVTHMHYRVQR